MAWNLTSGPVSRDVVDIPCAPYTAYFRGGQTMGAKTWMLVYADSSAREALRTKPQLDRQSTQRLATALSPEKNWMAWEIVTFPTRLLQTTSCTLGVFLEYQLLRPRNSVSTIRQCCPKNSLPREAPEQSPFTLCTAWSIGSRLRSGRTESCCVR